MAEQKRHLYSYPMAERDNPKPGASSLIPMTSAQREAFLGWYGDFRNPDRLSLAAFLASQGLPNADVEILYLSAHASSIRYRTL